MAQVREAASIEATAGILHNFLCSPNPEHLRNFLDQMSLFKESNKYNYRQTFIGMLQSIFIDFCQLTSASSHNLIEEVVIRHFQRDVLELSRDRVVNVRLCLASAFYYLHKTLDKLETQFLN